MKEFFAFVLLTLIMSASMVILMTGLLLATKENPLLILKKPGIWLSILIWSGSFVAAAFKVTS